MDKKSAEILWEHFISHPCMLMQPKGSDLLAPSKRQVNLLGGVKEHGKKFVQAMVDLEEIEDEWFDPSELPPINKHDQYGMNRSVKLLIMTKHDEMVMGYVQWDDEDWDDNNKPIEPNFYEDGRDAYMIDDPVKWSYAPEPYKGTRNKIL